MWPINDWSTGNFGPGQNSGHRCSVSILGNTQAVCYHCLKKYGNKKACDKPGFK